MLEISVELIDYSVNPKGIYLFMSRWSERFESHPTSQLFQQLFEIAKKLVEVQVEDSDAAFEIARSIKTCAFIKASFAAFDTDFITPQFIANMQSPLQNSISALNSAISSPTIANLQNANDHLDHVINTVVTMPTVAKMGKGTPIAKLLSDYNSSLQTHIVNVEKTASKEINKVKETSDEMFQYLAEKSEDSASNILENETELQAVRSSTETQIAEFGTQFNNLLSDMRKKHEAAIDANSEKSNNEFLDLTNKSGAILQILEKLQDDAETVFGVVQNTVQAGAHKNMQMMKSDKQIVCAMAHFS